MIEKCGILGAGIMGSGIAQVLAMAGLEVVVRDVNDGALASGKEKVDESLGRMLKKEKIEEYDLETVNSLLSWTTDLGQLRGCNLLIEAIPEDEDLKKDMYRSVEGVISDDAIIASNTSSISISSLGAGVKKPENFIGMHWFNPPVRMKLIEIVQGVMTSSDTVNSIVDLCKKLKKESIVCSDSQGFVTTRILLALRLECYRVFEEGIASKEDIDKACRLAFGHPMGQFELADFSGLDIEVNALRGMVEVYGDRFRPSQKLLNIVRAGGLGRKSGHGWYKY
jgi:3-hydroxybutyryl-CoA dehydrogenase